MPDHYTLLGVVRSASTPEIKTAYRRLVAQFHPDLNPDSQASEITARLNEAYAILCDETKRKTYDAELDAEMPWRLEGAGSGSSAAARASVPSRCQNCGRQDSTLRFSEFSYTLSFILTVRRGRVRGVWCERCRAVAAAKWSLVSGFAGWWGIPWGPVQTVQDLVANGRGGLQSASRNAALLRSVGYECYSRGDYDEARRALSASQSFKPDAEANALLEQLRSRLPPRSTAPAAWRWRLALAGPALIVAAVWGLIIFAALWRLARYRAEDAAPAPLTLRSTLSPGTVGGQDAVNLDLRHLARVIALRSPRIGTHYDGTALVTEYGLDRSHYEAAQLYPIAQSIGKVPKPGTPSADAFLASAYFNSMLFALSVDIVNRIYQGEPVAAPAAEAEKLGNDPRVAPWLRASRFWPGYQALQRTLATDVATYQPGQSVVEMETQAELIQVALQQTDSQQKLFQAEQYVEGYNRLVPVYNRNLTHLKSLSKKIQTQLGTAADLDAAFNRCLDASLLLSKSEPVTFTPSATKTKP